jgi:hypothetical protein
MLAVPIERRGPRRKESKTMKTTRSQSRAEQRRSAVAAALGALACCACHASVQADAQLNSGKSAEQTRDFDRPLEPASAAQAQAAADAAERQEYALLGARHDLNYIGDKTPSCQCLAVALSDTADNPAFQWELGTPQLEPSTQLVIAFTSNGVSCDSPPAGTLGASYQGYAIDGNDVVVSVEALGEGRPLTSGAIIPRPLGTGSVLIEPAGAVYGKPLDGKGKRCRLTLASAAPRVVLPGATGAK